VWVRACRRQGPACGGPGGRAARPGLASGYGPCPSPMSRRAITAWI